MVLPKTTLQFSRLAGTALKTFTHGYAQTVVAASQSTFNQQTSPTPLSGSFSNRFYSLSSRHHDVFCDSPQSPATSGILGHGLLKSGAARDVAGLSQSPKGRGGPRIAWKASTNVSSTNPHPIRLASTQPRQVVDAEITPPADRISLKRSYSTSAVYDFAKGIDDEAAEAVAFAQVNEAVTGLPQSSSLQQSPQTSPKLAPRRCSESASDSSAPLSLGTAATSLPESAVCDDVETTETRPSPIASEKPVQLVDTFAQTQYHALLAAVDAADERHEAAPQALQIYSQLLAGQHQPTQALTDLLVSVLAARALHVVKALQDQRILTTRFTVPGQLPDTSATDNVVFPEDRSLDLALSIAESQTVSPPYLQDLFEACAIAGRIPDVVRLGEQLFSSPTPPSSRMFPIMVAAHASCGHLDAAVDTYNIYKELAIRDNERLISMARIDNDVYASVIKAYGKCGCLDAGKRFFGRIHASEPDHVKKDALSDAVWLQAFLPLALQDGVPELLENWKSNVTPASLERAVSTFVVHAADSDNVAQSSLAYRTLSEIQADSLEPSIAMMSMHLRHSDLEAAEPYWRILESAPASMSLLTPAVMYATALILAGRTIEALEQIKQSFARIRSHARDQGLESKVRAALQTSIQKLVREIEYANMENEHASAAGVLRLMIDNESLSSTYASRTLAMVGPQTITHLSHDDLATFTKTQGQLILAQQVEDVAAVPRFTALLEAIVFRQILPDVATETTTEKTLEHVADSRLSSLWTSYRYPKAPSLVTSISPVLSAHSPFSAASEVDPYAGTTDNRGSTFITDLVDSPRKSPGYLLQALNKLRGMRRYGRHPRYFAYAKLISAAAKEGRFDLAREVCNAAEHDIPMQAEYRVVRHGWISILDSMLAACLTLNRRELAEGYHQQLLGLSAAPSANTYGLYIAGLKSTKSSDEASEALAIFSRARAEGVFPTSFLYNALIGKLGKARRIDDCLFHLGEMRDLGIRPTSVTYGTVVNALVRVSDEKFAEEIFEEMERAENYKPRPAPYHSLMQHFLTSKRDKSKVLSYYARMLDRGITPTSHTYKLLIDTHALAPLDLPAAEAVLTTMQATGHQPEPVHHAALIHAKGCVALDMTAARAHYATIPLSLRDASIFQAYAESCLANSAFDGLDNILLDMRVSRTQMSAYVANALIAGYAANGQVHKARDVFVGLGYKDREPSTYEAMVRAELCAGYKAAAKGVVQEAMGRGYPAAVAGKIAELI